jgi:hypothetical protein
MGLNVVQDAIVHMDMVINAEYTRIYQEERRIQVRHASVYMCSAQV